MMETLIKKQLEIIEKSTKWVKETDSMNGAKGDNAYRNLVNLRRKLNKKMFALDGNPAIAIYGASQMGKSYLVSGLLSDQGKPFNVIVNELNKYDFINKINPIGKRTEATSLATRFSTSYDWNNSAYPIKAKLLSPADLILVLCDTYYNDVKTKIDNALKSDVISENVSGIYAKYANKLSQQGLLGEDDILDIHDYFLSNFSTKATNVIHSTFFEKIPNIISKTNPEEWSEIFALFWNNNPKITKLFSELLKQYKRLDFMDVVYLPIDAVLRDNGTILDVARLHEIYGKYQGSEPNFQAVTSVMIHVNGQEKIIIEFSKSFLCALTAELIFKLPSELEESKPFLKNTDLLDFPGARNRLGLHEEDILDEDIPRMLLRGKVAYLFNKYSDSEKINILLFCQNNEKSEVQNILPELLNKWIEDMIGTSQDERNQFIEKSKIPPLFVISTMFNIDLQFDFNNDSVDNIDFRLSRWKRRFVTVFSEVFGSKKWLTEWTTNKSNFQNIYLLRDYFYSSDTESKIFKGYNENKIEQEEIIPDTYPNFRNDLRQSFLEYDFVNRHFANPTESYDRAASLNEDGTQLIIDKLIIAAGNIRNARYEKTKQELIGITQGIIKILNEYYNSPEKAENLLKAKSKAGAIQLKLDSALGGKNIELFGQMMKEIMVDSNTVFDFYEKKIKDIERRDIVNMDKYSNIRMNVGLEPNDNKGNLDRLRVAYEKPSVNEHYTINNFKEDFAAEGIDLDELLEWVNNNYEQVKSNAQVWAEELEQEWFKQCLQNKDNIIDKILDESMLLDIRETYKALFQKLHISKTIAGKVRRYMDGSRSSEKMHEMIADISAEIINNFIKSVGLEYYDESNLNDLKQANDKNQLGLVLEHEELNFEQNNREGAAELITIMANLPELLNQNPLPKEVKRLPNSRGYILWRDALKAGFVSVCDIPNYDVQANNKLKMIIDQCKTIEF